MRGGGCGEETLPAWAVRRLSFRLSSRPLPVSHTTTREPTCAADYLTMVLSSNEEAQRIYCSDGIFGQVFHQVLRKSLTCLLVLGLASSHNTPASFFLRLKLGPKESSANDTQPHLVIHALGSTFRQRTLPPLTIAQLRMSQLSLSPMDDHLHNVTLYPGVFLNSQLPVFPTTFRIGCLGTTHSAEATKRSYPCSTARHAAHCRAADFCFFQTTRSFLLLRLLLTAPPPGSQHMTPQSPLPFRPLSHSGVLLYRAVINLFHRHR